MNSTCDVSGFMYERERIKGLNDSWNSLYNWERLYFVFSVEDWNKDENRFFMVLTNCCISSSPRSIDFIFDLRIHNRGLKRI